jgi:hypothetical protein
VTGARGSALLLVIVATAGVGMMAVMLLLSGKMAYEISGLRADGLQAEALAEGTVRQVEAGLRSGAVPMPTAGRALRVTNGRAAGGQFLPVARFPRPPGPGHWPPVIDSPDDPPPGGGLGAEAEIVVVTGPRGEVRARTPGAEGRLVRVTVRAWFRRARAERVSSLLWVDGAVVRLD